MFFQIFKFLEKNLNISMIFLFFKYFFKKSDVKMFFYTWPIKKMSNQRHVLDSAELDWGGGILEKNYEDANQIENFIGVKIGNDIYYMGKKHY